MRENKKPRLAEVLGVEVGEKFDINGELCNPFCIYEDGFLYDNSGFRRSFEAIKIINYPELIKRRPRWTEQEVQDAKAILRVVESAVYVKRYAKGDLHILDGGQYFLVCANTEIFPSLHSGERIALNDIIGGNE